tara:strand:- start:52 stop:381 length:330 start_codon:yes stop_codon:yes gene_type:complete
MSDKEDLKSKLQELFNNWNDEESEKVIKDLMNARQILKEKRFMLLAISRIVKQKYAPSLHYTNEDYHKVMKEIQQILETEIADLQNEIDDSPENLAKRYAEEHDDDFKN